MIFHDFSKLTLKNIRRCNKGHTRIGAGGYTLKVKKDSFSAT